MIRVNKNRENIASIILVMINLFGIISNIALVALIKDFPCDEEKIDCIYGGKKM